MCHIPEESKTKVAKVLAKQHSLRQLRFQGKEKIWQVFVTSGYFLKTKQNGLGVARLKTPE